MVTLIGVLPEPLGLIVMIAEGRTVPRAFCTSNEHVPVEERSVIVKSAQSATPRLPPAVN
jgi:hypothetical protein